MFPDITRLRIPISHFSSFLCDRNLRRQPSNLLIFKVIVLDETIIHINNLLQKLDNGHDLLQDIPTYISDKLLSSDYPTTCKQLTSCKNFFASSWSYQNPTTSTSTPTLVENTTTSSSLAVFQIMRQIRVFCELQQRNEPWNDSDDDRLEKDPDWLRNALRGDWDALFY